MLYAVRWPADGFVKFCWAANAEQHLSDGFADVSHPNPQLCGRLTRPHFEIIGVWTGHDGSILRGEEERLHEQFNGGALRRSDNANEFYEVLEWPKIQRELDTFFMPIPIPEKLPAPNQDRFLRPCCRGWRHWCSVCKATFSSNSARKRHQSQPPPACKRLRDT